MPKNKPPNNKSEPSEIQKKEQTNIENFALEFANASQTYLSRLFGSPLYMNPFLQNQILKNINMNPVKYSREQIEKLISDPQYNEQAIRDLSEYLYLKIMHFNRMVRYFGEMLEFDWYLEPTNADETDMKNSSFKKSYKKAVNYIEKIDVKLAYPKILNMVMLHDIYFCYMRENEDYIVYQQMPSDYCLITYENELGYGYSFDCSYFLQTGVNIYDYDPIFLKYFEKYQETTEYKNRYPFWIKLDNAVAPVFKFDLNRASAVSPFQGTYMDANDIDTYKNLYQENAKLQTTKLLVSKIPMNESKEPQSKNNFAIDATTAGMFNAIIQAALPEMIKSITSPLDVEVIDFSGDTSTKNDIVGEAQKNFYEGSGTASLLFGQSPDTQSGVRASQKTDEYFVKHMYKQFERHLNYHLRKNTGRYRFKIHFEGSMWDREERRDQALKVVEIGGPITYLAVAIGKTQQEFMNMLNLEKALGIKDRLVVPQSIHTTSNKEGRPKSSDSDLSDTGEASRDKEINTTY